MVRFEESVAPALRALVDNHFAALDQGEPASLEAGLDDPEDRPDLLIYAAVPGARSRIDALDAYEDGAVVTWTVLGPGDGEAVARFTAYLVARGDRLDVRLLARDVRTAALGAAVADAFSAPRSSRRPTSPGGDLAGPRVAPKMSA